MPHGKNRPCPSPELNKADPSALRRDLLQRLPADVLKNYAYVKLIIMSAPIELMATLLLHPDGASDPMVRLFRKGLYGQILDAIDTEEKQVRELYLTGDDTRRQALSRLEGLRFLLYRSLLTEPALAAQGRSFKVLFCATDFDAEGRPRYIYPPIRIEVWTRPKGKRQEPKLRGERVVPHSPGRFSLAVADLLKAHCCVEKLRRLRFRRPWWTGRSPEGWPVVTQHIVPLLYDHLLPYYPVRRYTRSGNKPGPGAFPLRLMDDIADILRMELPYLCRGLTRSRVLAAVRRYTSSTSTADPMRPMGEAMFRVASGNVSNSIKKGEGTER